MKISIIECKNPSLLSSGIGEKKRFSSNYRTEIKRIKSVPKLECSYGRK